MRELELAKRFSEDIDRILKDNGAKIAPAGEDSGDYLEAVELARRLAAMEFTGECKSAGDLRRRLLERIGGPGKKRRPGGETPSTELSDDDLDNVAGGIDPHRDRLPEE